MTVIGIRVSHRRSSSSSNTSTAVFTEEESSSRLSERTQEFSRWYAAVSWEVASCKILPELFHSHLSQGRSSRLYLETFQVPQYPSRAHDLAFSVNSIFFIQRNSFKVIRFYNFEQRNSLQYYFTFKRRLVSGV